MFQIVDVSDEVKKKLKKFKSDKAIVAKKLEDGKSGNLSPLQTAKI